MNRPRDALLSIVVPVHNEEACLRELHARLDAAISSLQIRVEFLLVDDNSADTSFEIVRELAARDPRVRGFRLTRNVGPQAAILCGLEHASGDVVLTMDADLQHPPSCIPRMLESWRAGFDVVNMNRSSLPRLSPLRAVLTPLFYRILNFVSDSPISPRSTDFRLLDMECVDAMLSDRRRLTFVRGAVARIGFRQTNLDFESPTRFSGASSFTLTRLFMVAANAIYSSSWSAPPRLKFAIGNRPIYVVRETVNETASDERGEKVGQAVDERSTSLRRRASSVEGSPPARRRR